MESIDDVMTRYMRYVYAVVSGILGAGHGRDAEEVVADTFVAYWRTERYVAFCRYSLICSGVIVIGKPKSTTKDAVLLNV